MIADVLSSFPFAAIQEGGKPSDVDGQFLYYISSMADLVEAPTPYCTASQGSEGDRA